MTVSERALRIITIVGIFLLPFVPIIVSSSLFFPYITGKNFTFRLIVELISCTYLALALINPVYRPRRSWILIAFLAFVTIIALADAQGVNPFKSFWSNYERMDGWVTIAHLLCYIIVASSVLNVEKLWRRLFLLTLGVSVFLDFYGFLQIAGGLALGEGGSGGFGARIDATFGNPIYLAAYMLFHVFIAAMLIVQQGKERWSTMERVLFPVGLFLGLIYVLGTVQAVSAGLILFYLVLICGIVGVMFLPQMYLLGLAILLDTSALLFTATRGTILGLIGGVIVTALVYIWKAENARRVRPFVVGGIAGLVVFAGILYAAKDTPFVQGVSFLNRLSSLSVSDPTIKSRFINIETAWKGIEERPLLGWGQENFAIVFDKYYDPRMYGSEAWFDRVHNIIFDWWIAGGTIGLLAYLAIFGVLLWVLWRSRAFSAAERSILIGLVVGYFIHNTAVFDNITSYILFGTILAYVMYREGATGETKPVWLPQLWRDAAPVAATGALLGALGIMWLVNGPAFEENRLLLAALAQQNGGLSQNLAEFEKAISYGTYGTQEAREQLSQIATTIATVDAVPADLKQQFATTAVNEMQLQEKASPLDARFPLFLSSIYDAYGQYGLAKDALTKAHELSPGKQIILITLGMNAQAQGDAKGAEDYFGQAYKLDTDYLDARIYYAASAIAAGDESTADQLLTPIAASGAAADPRIAAAYGLKKEYSKIIPLWEAHVTISPSDTQGYYTLAAAYYATGNRDKAITTLQRDAAANPADATKAQQLIEQIRAGNISIQ